MLLTGASAGGIGVNNNCNWLADALQSSGEVLCLPQSGFFFPRGVVALWQQRLLPWLNMTSAEIGALWVTTLYSSQLDTRCAAAQSAKNESASFCWDASHVLPHLQPRTLVAQNYWVNYRES